MRVCMSFITELKPLFSSVIWKWAKTKVDKNKLPCIGIGWECIPALGEAWIDKHQLVPEKYRSKPKILRVLAALKWEFVYELHHDLFWRNNLYLKGIMISKINQREKDKYCVSLFYMESENIQTAKKFIPEFLFSLCFESSAWAFLSIRLLCPWRFPGKNTGMSALMQLQNVISLVHISHHSHSYHPHPPCIYFKRICGSNTFQTIGWVVVEER